jgi:hypothetical protein
MFISNRSGDCDVWFQRPNLCIPQVVSLLILQCVVVDEVYPNSLCNVYLYCITQVWIMQLHLISSRCFLLTYTYCLCWWSISDIPWNLVYVIFTKPHRYFFWLNSKFVTIIEERVSFCFLFDCSTQMCIWEFEIWWISRGSGNHFSLKWHCAARDARETEMFFG